MDTLNLIAFAYLAAAIIVVFAAQIVSAVYGAWCLVQWWHRKRVLRAALGTMLDEAEEPAE